MRVGTPCPPLSPPAHVCCFGGQLLRRVRSRVVNGLFRLPLHEDTTTLDAAAPRVIAHRGVHVKAVGTPGKAVV